MEEALLADCERGRQAVWTTERELAAGSIQGKPEGRADDLEISHPKMTIPARGFSVSLSTEEQLAGLMQWLEMHPDRHPDGKQNADDTLACIYLSEQLVYHLAHKIKGICKELSGRCPLLIALPYILRESDEACLEELFSMCGSGKPFSGYLIRSADGLGFLNNREKNGLWHLDASVYTWNRAAAEQLGEKIDSFCLPYELKAAEQRQLLHSGLPFEKAVYGRIPMMITANCILRTSDRCNPESSAETVLIDRYGKRFPVVRSCAHCTNIIYNSIPLSLHRELEKWTSNVRCRLDFTVENAEETKHVLDVFLLGKDPDFEEYTTGHEKRGLFSNSFRK